MNNSLAFLASSFGLTFALVSTVLVILAFIVILVIFWWIDTKKRPLRELGTEISHGIWRVGAKIAEFVNPNSTVHTVYSDKSLNYSGTEFLPIPTKAPTNQYTYEFVGWDKNGVDENGNVVVRAIYLQKVTKCYINVYEDDKTTLLKSMVVEYGAGVNLDDVHPEKAESKEFSYEFIGWDKDITEFYQNENVYAVYKAIPKKYVYTFFDADGETILNQGTAIYGTPISAPTAPKKDSTADEVFEFAGWKGYEDGMILTKDVSFVASYDSKPLSISGNSSIIKTEGEKIKVVNESKLSPKEDKAKQEELKAQSISSYNLDKDRGNAKLVTEIKPRTSGVLKNKRRPGSSVVVEMNKPSDAERFAELNSADAPKQVDKDVHQKIQLVNLKKTKDIKENSEVIKSVPKHEEGIVDENELLNNMMFNKIKIEKKEDDK